MSGMSKLGITLTSIFTVTLLALLSQILYLLWRRRQYTRRNITRIEPAMPSVAPPPLSTTLCISPDDQSEIPKFEAIYGPSRVLFTIKEEEREELEITNLSSFRDSMNIEMASLSERFDNGSSFLEDYVISMVGDYSDAEPPFLTPCASPLYYTPSPSPPREG